VTTAVSRKPTTVIGARKRAVRYKLNGKLGVELSCVGDKVSFGRKEVNGKNSKLVEGKITTKCTARARLLLKGRDATLDALKKLENNIRKSEGSNHSPCPPVKE